ncbi:hypothetical protein Verru16b_01623 [Lacunisphaera limnophila]|uniref:DUF1343 domain-containing protein n=1 Tax=Lacunisphaera limnophila TaxID=1838286 RepID=A0A1D8AUL1_9BACT|nr:DUF1343 domain-containing protein [Lacunisphaera limnophila]AOS44560.1 hypothetical protein Verru16b_01623 [Lacunisphaera limnophila]
MTRRSIALSSLVSALAALALLAGCASDAKKPEPKKPAAPVARPEPAPTPAPPPEKLPRVMLGIDVLEAEGFKAIAGKRLGLLTHRAGVNRRGESTINVLRRAPQSKLVCLFAPENGLDGTTKSATRFDDAIHAPTGLPIYSLYGKNKRPTKEQLKDLHAVVIDLQDIGVRSYTFISWMRYTMEACFENGVEVIILDRPNPLGGLKVDGPPLDAEWMSDVGAFRVPYVHGLTMGELATMAQQAPRVLHVKDSVRAKGKLTVVPMRGWHRAMRWPETELTWVQTSPMITSYDAVIGYAMIGLGCEQTAWRQVALPAGYRADYPTRGISHPKKTPEEIIAALEAFQIPGIRLVKRETRNAEGKPLAGVFVEVVDWTAWRPTELSFYMHKQAEKWSPLKVFASLTGAQQRTFQIHVGSTAWYEALSKEGMRVDVAAFVKNWSERAAVYQLHSKKYWLYD